MGWLYREYMRNCEEFGVLQAGEMLSLYLYAATELMEDDIETICEDYELCYRAEHWSAPYMDQDSIDRLDTDVPF